MNDLTLYEELKTAIEKNDLETANKCRMKISKKSQDLLHDSYFLIRTAKKENKSKEISDQDKKSLEEVKAFHTSNPADNFAKFRQISSKVKVLIEKIQDPDLQVDAWEFCGLDYVKNQIITSEAFPTWLRSKDKNEGPFLPTNR